MSDVVTAVAILIAAAWAYFKFVKGRTFRPRLQVDLAGEWLKVAGQEALHLRLTVANIGAAKLNVLQNGSGIRLSVHDAASVDVPSSAQWQTVTTVSTLMEHAWIEPLEHVIEDGLFYIPSSNNLALVEVRLVLKRLWPFRNIVVMSRQILTESSTLSQDAKGES